MKRDFIKSNLGSMSEASIDTIFDIVKKDFDIMELDTEKLELEKKIEKINNTKQELEK